ncbi:MAG: L,D-transpeptidase family protein [Anaerolineae bacterium]
MDHDIAALLREGEATARKGQKAEARRVFRAVLARDPVNIPALLWMTWLSEDPQAGLAYAERALAHDPGNAPAQAAHRWACSRVDSAASPATTPPEALRRGANRVWLWLVPAIALGCVVILACALGALLLLARHSPHRVPLLGALVATPCPTPRSIETPTSVPSPAATATAVAPATPTAIPTATPTPTPTKIDTPTPTQSKTPTPSQTPSPTPPLSPTATPSPTQPSPSPTKEAAAPADPSDHSNARWIDVDLTHQTVTAYEGQTSVRTTLASTGLPRTPTPVGEYTIYVKYVEEDMSGPGYYLPNVPYTMYFHRGYGIHGTYWHSNFGHPMSHGCINLPTEEAEWFFDWASVGTLVKIHR